jgi:hypothetical protein
MLAIRSSIKFQARSLKKVSGPMRQVSMRPMATSEPQPTKEETPATPVVEASSTATAMPPTPPAPTPIPTPAAPSIGEAMAFSGSAPEIINGRLAMLGFVAAMGAEFASQETVVQQVAEGPKVLIFGTFLLFAIASLIPILKGTKKEAFGPFTPAAEMTNGRAAMLGIAFMLVAEASRHAPIF